ncbi:MAG: MBL fold metallo-hydrolase [Chloroflexi bacterium]|nr:MAG: MBL fold metallo-hydrolase [Chloroflexota bacterium]
MRRRPGRYGSYPTSRRGVSRILGHSMDLTWLGHACFRMRGREGVVLTDPPDPRSGHAIPKTDASLVTISHDHPGHSSLRSVGGEPVVLRGPGEYEVKEVLVTGIATFHDDDKGATRGRNTVFAIRLDDLVVCHLGDLGHELPAADLERLGDIDIVLVPISGADTNLTAAKAAEIVHQLEPKVVVPMSYDPDDKKKDTPFQRLLHELGVKELTPVPKLSVTRSSLPENVQVVALDSRAR